MTLRCIIVDDSAGFLHSARLLLEREGIAVVGVASTGDAALEQAEELRPDVVLLDIDLGEENGLEVARRLRREASPSPTKVVLISAYAEEDFADLIAASPAAGFLSKSDLSADAIRHVLQGESERGPGTDPLA